jgi:hypothetical protein
MQPKFSELQRAGKISLTRTFRRCMARYEENGLEGLKDRRLEGASAGRAPMDEVMELTEKYKSRHQGWSVKYFIPGTSRRADHAAALA